MNVFKKSKIFLLVYIAIAAISCKKNCNNEIIIYEGLYFDTGQSYVLNIENGELVEKEHFKREEIRGSKFRRINSYCCPKDSCKVKFTLDSMDTTFYISPKKTKRLMIGSTFYGNFSIATDENKDSWAKM